MKLSTLVDSPAYPWLKSLWYALLLVTLYLLRSTPPADFRYWGM